MNDTHTHTSITAWELDLEDWPRSKFADYLEIIKGVAQKSGFPDTAEGIRAFLDQWLMWEYERITREADRTRDLVGRIGKKPKSEADNRLHRDDSSR